MNAREKELIETIIPNLVKSKFPKAQVRIICNSEPDLDNKNDITDNDCEIKNTKYKHTLPLIVKRCLLKERANIKSNIDKIEVLRSSEVKSYKEYFEKLKANEETTPIDISMIEESTINSISMKHIANTDSYIKELNEIDDILEKYNFE